MTSNLPALTADSLAADMQYAKALAASDLLPAAFRGKPANILVAVGYGRALGLEPMIALSGITVIDGKPSLSAQLQSALVRRAGHRLRVEHGTGECTAILVRTDDPNTEHRATWTLAKAQQAGLAGRGAWRTYPEAMLAARAITEVIRVAASDVMLGAAYTPEEFGQDDGAPPQPIAVEQMPATPYDHDDDQADTDGAP